GAGLEALADLGLLGAGHELDDAALAALGLAEEPEDRRRRQGAPAVEVLFDLLVAERRGEGPFDPLPHLAQHAHLPFLAEDKGTRRQGDKETKAANEQSPPNPLVPLSPCLLVPLSFYPGQPRRTRSLLIRRSRPSISRGPGEGSPARLGGISAARRTGKRVM